MKHAAFAALLSAVALAQPSGSITDPDAYAVYNAVIRSDWLLRVAHATELLIEDATVNESPSFKQCVPAGPDMKGAWADALNEFKTQQTTAKFLDRQFSLPVAYRLESKDTIRSFFTAAGPMGWDGFHATYPNAHGYLELSAVGFDKTHEHAIVYLAHSCGRLCGEGSYHFLERKADAWTEVRLNVSSCMWVS
jgi:hypothetical protein